MKTDNNDHLSVNKAYAAMLVFLDDYCARGGGPVEVLLHDMMFLADGDTVDPALWDDWIQAVREVQAASPDPKAWELLWKRLDSKHRDFE